MTTKRTYACNVCKELIGSTKSSGVGFLFKSGRTEFEETTPDQAENHLCNSCIRAIWDMSNRLKRDGKI